MFRTLIYPSSGTCYYSVELPHWSYVLVSICVGVSVWLGWSGIHIAGFSLLYGYRVAGWSLLHGYHSIPATPKLQHISKQEHTTNEVIQQNSSKFLMMDILMSETCWAYKKWNKITSDIKLVSYSSTITMMHGPINIKKLAQFGNKVLCFLILRAIENRNLLPVQHNISVRGSSNARHRQDGCEAVFASCRKACP